MGAVMPSTVIEPRPTMSRYLMLGPLEVRSNGAVVRLSAAKHRALLAAMLLQPNQFVQVDRLVFVLWGENPPERAVETVRNYVLRIRRALTVDGPDQLIETGNGGYRISVDRHATDVVNFRELVASARVLARSGDYWAAAAQVREALRLWRGAPLVDVPSDVLQQTEVPRLTEARVEAFELLVELELALGHCREILPELAAEVRAHPGRESLWRHMLLALYQAGRKCDALNEYQALARYLRVEYGIEPGRQLHDLYVQILRDDSQLG
jgi:DNA-binding SARP family transcriptional activator